MSSYTLLELDNPYYVCISRSLLFCTCAIFNGSHYQVTWETNFLFCVLLCSVTNNKVSCTNICIAVQRWYVPDYEMHDTVTTLNITYLHIHGHCSIRQRKYKLYHFIYFLAATILWIIFDINVTIKYVLNVIFCMPIIVARWHTQFWTYGQF